jgi:hypothetical protein
MNTDPTVTVSAIVGVFGFIIALAFLVRLRSRTEAAKPVVSEAERAAAADRRRREAEVEKGVKENRLLPDGRPRCQASLNCPDPAEFARPRIVRDEGVVDFIRRAFGAHRRYRMQEPQGITSSSKGFFGAIFDVLLVAFQGPPKPVAPGSLKYCELHVHIARQVCLEKLSADEHAEATALSERENSLTHFEGRGMEKKVLQLVAEIETAEAGKKKRVSRETERGAVIPINRAAGGSGGQS